MIDDFKLAPNIYAQWYNALTAKGRGAAMKPVKGLQSLSIAEMHSLMSLLNEELKIRQEEINAKTQQ